MLPVLENSSMMSAPYSRESIKRSVPLDLVQPTGGQSQRLHGARMLLVHREWNEGTSDELSERSHGSII